MTNATFPYVLEIANKGFRRAAKENPAVAAGFNVLAGRVVYHDLAALFATPLTNLKNVL